MRALIASTLLLFTVFLSFSQKVKSVSGEYTLYASENTSIEEAKRIALERAKIEAIAKEFGTIINQSNSTVVSTTNGDSNINFTSLSSSDVKGEWIEDTGEPSFTISFQDHLLIVECKVKGKVREVSGAKIQYEALPLRNGKERKFSGTDFRDGDDMFLYFNSPVNGYLAVFLLDETDQTVYSILPYRRDSNSVFPIEKDTDYILFSRDNANDEMRPVVDEYVMNSKDGREFNTLYILFSPKQFYKGKGYSKGTEVLPDNIPFLEFRSWMGKLLARNPDIQLSQISLTVTK